MSVQQQRRTVRQKISTSRFSPVDRRLPEILFITSYPPRECGIATYSQDLIKALNNKFNQSFTITICALESDHERHVYPNEVKLILDTDQPNTFIPVAKSINDNSAIQVVLIQHEFGFFKKCEDDFILFLEALTKPIAFVFHTVLPRPNESLKTSVMRLADVSQSLIVMTHSSAGILMRDYEIQADKISVIPHGTHLVPNADTEILKDKYNLVGKKVLSTFGLLGPGKNIETTLTALPSIIKMNPDVLFLIIGKTHPSLVKHEGEKYREMLKAKVLELNLDANVRFINKFLPLPELLDYLQLTDIYLFTSKDPNQAVSGTFSYAISCGCPVISTAIPHAREVLKNDSGIIIDFESPLQVANSVNRLLSDERLRRNISANGLHRIAPTAWENSAIAHAILFETLSDEHISLRYTLPPVNLDHFKRMTTDFGMIQFSKISQPDLDSGYTVDDNARALVAMCMHYELNRDETSLPYITIYLNFIKHCLRMDGSFLNYVSEERIFTQQNNTTNLADANGRAVWALGYFLSMSDLLPDEFRSPIMEAEITLQHALLNICKTHSTRSMAFVIKGLYYYNLKKNSIKNIGLIKELADRLVQMYRHESKKSWEWFESYLTYANSILPEAMLCAWLATGELVYKEIAKASFNFLLLQTFSENRIKVISNKNWLDNPDQTDQTKGGEQPIDVAYTILALSKFYEVFHDREYLKKIRIAFEWFLGNNQLNQIIYNPCTGGCYDGLEDNYVNLNQGAESTVSYLMARLTVDPRYQAMRSQKIENQKQPTPEAHPVH